MRGFAWNLTVRARVKVKHANLSSPTPANCELGTNNATENKWRTRRVIMKLFWCCQMSDVLLNSSLAEKVPLNGKRKRLCLEWIAYRSIQQVVIFLLCETYWRAAEREKERNTNRQLSESDDRRHEPVNDSKLILIDTNGREVDACYSIAFIE